jgi:hypothetical protein
MKMIQRGRNNKYPEKIDTWQKSERDIPEWLTDIAKVEMVDLGSGRKKIRMNSLTSGGVEIIAADGQSILIRTQGESDYVCFGDNKLFSLTESQMGLLYKQSEDK